MPDGHCRVAIVYPPSRTQTHGQCPMGMLMLATVLERAGCEVRILDANAVNHQLTSEELAHLAREFAPDVIGMTLVTSLVREGYRLAGLLRSSGVKLLAGGPHATLLPEEPLAHGFDAVVIGEGEPVIEAAVSALIGRTPMDAVPGWAYLDEAGQIRRTPPCDELPDLDQLPYAARHLAEPSHYTPLREHAVMFSSRGCPARCSYCAGQLFGKKFRFRAAENVVGEIIEARRKYGTEHFHFVDDSMGCNRDRMKAICRGIAQANLGITWSMMTRIDTVNEEVLTLAAQSGCTEVHYGVESGSALTLRKIHKPLKVEMVREIIPLTRKAGIRPVVFFILGFPWESIAMLEETHALIRDLAPFVDEFHPAIAGVLVPFPATEIYDTYKEEYGFERWWLSDERNYDAPVAERHAHFEKKLCRNGVVLDADFFRYPPHIKRKIYEVLRFMYLQNLKNRTLLSRATLRLLLDLSMTLAARWPRAERAVFGALDRLRLVGRSMAASAR